MTGSGGMGAMPSNRLARLLEEKADALRKRRKTAETASEQAENRLRLLAELGIELPETPSRQDRLHEWQRKSDWDAMELEAIAFSKYLDEAAPGPLAAKRHDLMDWVASLQAVGGAIPPELGELAAPVRELTFQGDVAADIATLARYAILVRGAQTSLAKVARQQVLAVAEWAGIPSAQMEEIDRRLAEILPASGGGTSAEWVERLRSAIPELIPAATERRARVRSEAEALIALGRDIGLPTGHVEEALATDGGATPTQWGESVPTVERALSEVQGELRARITQVLTYLVTTLNSLREHGADPTEPIAEIEHMRAEVESAALLELGPLLQRARTIAEEPLVAVVAGLLDEVRPKLVEARELGRDPSEVFASMNRAREALRLKIYSEALAASVEAIDRVSQLTSDLDSAREESEALDRLLTRLESLTSTVAPHRAAVTEIARLLQHYEIDRARTSLRETVRALGRDAARHFGGELQRLQGAAELARQRGFLPDSVPGELEQARTHLDSGSLPEAGEALARTDVLLRTAAGPYLSRRVEEMRRGFEEIHDPDLPTHTLRALADADIALRVKEDVTQSLESLRQAEREFSAAFAAESSSLLEALEERQAVLEEMGGAGSDFLRQTDEIQQIFDMGDFVKCARSAREFLAATEEVQKARAEEGLSFAKLDLIELDKLGAQREEFAKRYDSAQQALSSGRWVEAYRTGMAIHTDLTKVLETARSANLRVAQVKEELFRLEQSGTDSGEFEQEIGEAERAVRALDFEGARAHLEHLQLRMRAAAQTTETQRILDEAEQLGKDAGRLGIPIEAIEAQLTEARGGLLSAPGPDPLALARGAHESLVRMLIPVLQENLRSVEEDFETARRAGVDLGPLAGLLAEASRRAALPIPIGAAERIESARTQLSQTRGLVEHAERSVRRVEEAFGQAELLRLATPALRARVESLEQHVSEGRFARAVEMAGPLEQEILRATTQHLTRTVAGLQGLVVRARQDGQPTAAAENLLTRAKEALQGGRPMEALQLAAQSEVELERAGLQTRVAQGAVEAIDAKLARFQAEGIRSPRVTAIATEARTALEQGEFARVIELSLEANDLLAQSRELHRRAEEALENAGRQVRQAITMGAEPSAVAAVLEKARDFARAGEYASAVAHSREAMDLSGWAIERRYAGAIAEVRGLLAAIPAEQPTEAETVSADIQSAEALLQSKEWAKAEEALERARSGAVAAIEQGLERRLERAKAGWPIVSPEEPEEGERRRKWEAEIEAARGRRAYSEVVSRIEEEERRTREARRARLERIVTELKDRLWVGERLGLDTTPAMERFSEARLALDQGRDEVVEREVGLGNAALEGLIRDGISRRSTQVETELRYARDGIRVRIGGMEQSLATVGQAVAEDRLVEAGRTLLSVEEDLNQRKSLHRELMNLHYLIEAALRRAADAHLDTGEARRLFEESIRESASNYSEAIAKARAALKLVEGMLKATEPPTAFWPFKRPSQ